MPYTFAIGSIMYAMLCTRQDILYALSVTSMYQSNPGDGHWIAVKNILKYFRRTKEMFLVYGGLEELVVKGYTDASFQIDQDDSKSQSGYVFCLNGGAVSWKSSKQETVADSTTEAEYIAALEAAKEAARVRNTVPHRSTTRHREYTTIASICKEVMDKSTVEGEELRGNPMLWTIEHWTTVLGPCAGSEGDLLFEKNSVGLTRGEEFSYGLVFETRR
ncbi:hypothetical protein AXG93_809s1010 [Marchantia polymorpha subsp. ruderalis]|uniref:Reverse transcriptase Ty1/copia-type domain-containing protein n=1 Tax=Marchantia polymorpha subsp. ruderalis TaxID=1480154 RepID=A0A176WGG6_MARPO|nr:hypothetical protein AXG93_809s1010 [Marchantia polymorpha subsp. ruderalis]